jgi:spermidine/putrescine transport system ATP-binding protein
MLESEELVLQGLGKSYGDFVALADVQMTVPPGSYVVLLGPSGSGKTTLLSILGGFTPPGRGRILLGGKDITAMPPAQRPTATVFQDYALFPHLSIGENVGFGLSVRKVAAAQVRKQVDAALALVGLDGFATRPIAAASGGQRQRIALARALVIEPSLLLLDEPLGALDLSLRRQMQEELRRIQRSQGRTFIHVTHDQEEAMAIADLVVIMNRGRIEDMGPPQRIYQQPRTRFAASFLGESSVIDGTVREQRGAELLIESPCGVVSLPGQRSVGDKVSIALRPEAIRFGTASGDDLPLGRIHLQEAVYQGSFVRLRGVTPAGVSVLAKTDPLEVQTALAGAGELLNRLPLEVEFSVRRSGLVLLED